jgi:hypothetical protein
MAVPAQNEDPAVRVSELLSYRLIVTACPAPAWFAAAIISEAQVWRRSWNVRPSNGVGSSAVSWCSRRYFLAAP